MNLEQYKSLLSTDVSDAMGQKCAMDIGIRSVFQPAPAIMGFAFTVKCVNHSNTYLHDAIYSAPKGAIVVAEVDENNYAVAGGNVCSVAQLNGIAGFVIDGAARDLGEIRSIQFPVFARGMYPKPGGKKKEGESQVPIQCGGLEVKTGDLIVADEEGIVVVPKTDVESVLEQALIQKEKAEQTSLEQWREKHQAAIKAIVEG